MTNAVSIAQSGSNNTSFRNRIINGAMVIDQRNAGALISTGATVPYTLDRWLAGIGYSTGATVQQSTSAPTGFNNSLIVTVGTGASASASNTARALQTIEGFNVADLGWGTASAQTITLSFWVKSSLTGTFAGGIYNNAANRTYVFTYTINAANTWEQKTITIAGDQSGTWLTTNGGGMYVNWDLGTGSTYQATAGAWAAGAAWATSGSVKLGATSGATWSITGVQLEAGSTASPFENRSYGVELALCQRYYYQITGNSQPIASGYNRSTTSVYGYGALPVPMRIAPSLTSPNSAGYFSVEYGTTGNATIPTLSLYVASTTGYFVNGTPATSVTAASGNAIFTNNSSSYLGFSSEL